MRATAGVGGSHGLRTPSETLALKWSDVDGGHERFTVTSPKTATHERHESRVVPFFVDGTDPKQYFEEAFEQARECLRFQSLP